MPAGSGPDFVNGAIAAETDLEPDALLARLHEIEAELGRTRNRRWQPRVCDLDLIAVGGAVSPDRDTVAEWMALDLGKAQTVTPPWLVLPHPRMHQRAFVLMPLRDIAPDWRHPMTGETVAAMAAALPAEALQGIAPMEDP